MTGVRIHHQSKRLCYIEVPHPGRRVGRRPKVYRIELDGNGDAIVSPVVLDRLLEAFGLLGLAPTFVVLNEVVKPPDILIDLTAPKDDRPTYRER